MESKEQWEIEHGVKQPKNNRFLICYDVGLSVAVAWERLALGHICMWLYGVGAFNEVSVVAMLKAGMDGEGYGAAAAFGASFLFARMLEGSLVGILDLGGSLLTGVGIGIPAL